jgi:hypothetical protein
MSEILTYLQNNEPQFRKFVPLLSFFPSSLALSFPALTLLLLPCHLLYFWILSRVLIERK